MDTQRIGKVLGNRLERALTHLRGAVSRTTGRPVANFLHVGKTGGTAVKEALKPHLDEGHYAVLLHPHSFGLGDVRRGEKVFFFLRHPVSRFVSGFYSRQREGRPRYFVPWRPEEREAFARFSTASQLAHALQSLDAGERKAAVHAMSSIRHVRDSFDRWFGNEEYFISRKDDILFAGFQEHMDRDIAALQKILGLVSPLRLPSAEDAAHRNPHRDEPLDDKAIAILKEWYARDIAFYELCRRLFAADR